MSFRLIVLLIISVSSCTPKTYPEEDKKKRKKNYTGCDDGMNIEMQSIHYSERLRQQ